MAAAKDHVVECRECRARVAEVVSATQAQNNEVMRRGDVVDGKYRIDRVLGAGGMGMVVLAQHLELDCAVALKFMLADAMADPDLVRRFSREARAAARLRSEHATRIFDVGKLSSGAPYLVMEYLDGRDLASLLVEKKRLEVGEAVRYALQACVALGEAHACGIVHRDLKPQNIFLTKGPRGQPLVKVLDFGLAKLDAVEIDEAARSGVTRTGMLLGSPNYVAPEQLHDPREADGRVDVWALGACLYEMLAGRRAFAAPTWPLLSAMILMKEPPQLRELRRSVPEPLANIVHRCLRKAPEERFQSNKEM
jgi:serine/threonine-protein kinase